MLNVALGAKDEDTLTSLANRLVRLNSQMTPGERKEFEENVGTPSGKLAESLLNAFDEEVIKQTAVNTFQAAEPDEEQLNEAQKALIAEAVKPFYDPDTRDFILGKIFKGATNKISNAAILSRIVAMIDKEKWVAMSSDVKGEIYEGLLQKNAEDIKSGAGQYFTPRPLIKAMVRCIRPEPMKSVADPCCGSGGFLLAAQDYITDSKNYTLDREQKEYLKAEAFHGNEIVPTTFKLCLMNLYLHNIGDIYGNIPVTLGDALLMDSGERYDYVLTNPPFGKKSSITFTNEEGEQEDEDLVYNRQDFWTTSSNKQLNFVQHINTILKSTGKAAVVVPDNVLFEGGAGETVRRKLLETTDLHTILRLPTGIFYKPGVKAKDVCYNHNDKCVVYKERIIQNYSQCLLMCLMEIPYPNTLTYLISLSSSQIKPAKYRQKR